MNFHSEIAIWSPPPTLPTVTLGGLPITVVNRAQAADFLLKSAAEHPRGGKPLFFTSANGEVLAQCYFSSRIRALFMQADQIVADGQPMVTASRHLCRTALPERVATTDFFHDVAKRAEITGQSNYFFGATEVENNRAVAAVSSAYPKLNISGRSHGYLQGAELDAKLAEINAIGPDVLWLAMGVPREQEFMAEHGHKLSNVGLVKTSGGLFNFLSGTNPRAPQFMQAMGLEWAWRMMIEPRRLGWRYLTTNPVALMLMLTHSR